MRRQAWQPFPKCLFLTYNFADIQTEILKQVFTLLIHIYYHDSWEYIFRQRLKKLEMYAPQILVNLCLTHEDNYSTIAAIRSDFPEALFITTPNKGRDIGGKLALIDLLFKRGKWSDYLVFLHDKKSLHAFEGEIWREKLFSIIETVNVSKIIAAFNADKNAGIIGVKDFIKNEFDPKNSSFKTVNSDKLNELITLYGLKVGDHSFVAGTMFWMRSVIAREFFSRYSPQYCRELLEEGNFTDHEEGTYTHSWERVFCWLASDQSYSIKGI